VLDLSSSYYFFVDLTNDFVFAQDELKDDKHIHSSHLYSLVKD
jgi:hypothetical protein